MPRDEREPALPHPVRRDWLFLVALVAVTLVGPLAIHLYLPAMPAVQRAFGATVAAAQFALSVSLLIMAGATLAYGSLSDRFGRRPVLLVGLALFTAGAAVCAAAPGMAVLIAGRAVQAAGAACGLVLARAMVSDVYGLDRLVRAIAYLTMAYVIGPMVAPALGGLLVDRVGWRAVFVFGLASGGAILLLAALALGETHRRRDAGPRPTVLGGYARLMRSVRFSGYVLHTGFAAGTFLSYISYASFLMSDALRRPAAEFGLYFLLPALGYVAGNFVSGRLGGRARIETMVIAGSVVVLAAIAAMAGAMALGGMTPLALFLPGAFISLGQGLSMPNAQSGAIAVDRGLAGTASGAIMFLHLLCGAVFSQVAGLAADGTPGPMFAVIGTTALLALICGAVPALPRFRAAG